MVDFETARRLMQDYLAELAVQSRKKAESQRSLSPRDRETLGLSPEFEAVEYIIHDEATMEEDLGWVFFYSTRAASTSDGRSFELAGNAPVIVSRRDGSLHETGTALPIESYIENFKASGNPQS